MARPRIDKSDLLTALAAHVLEHGLNTASLRPMAAAAGTSDRMLIYHFGSKDGLVTALLDYLAAAFERRLDIALPAKRYDSESALLQDVAALVRTPEFSPYIRIWLDIVSASAQGQTAHREAGRAIINTFLNWLAIRHPEGSARAAFMLTMIEGIHVMDAIGQSDTADAAIIALSKRSTP